MGVTSLKPGDFLNLTLMNSESSAVMTLYVYSSDIVLSICKMLIDNMKCPFTSCR